VIVQAQQLRQLGAKAKKNIPEEFIEMDNELDE
jgi:hypothetical protein